MYIDRTTSVVIMCAIVVVIVIAVSVATAQKHSDEIANLRDLLQSNSADNNNQSVVDDSQSAKAASLPGGWYSNWDVIDQTIRRPRRSGAVYANQTYYAPSVSGGDYSYLTPAGRFANNSRGTGNPMITSVKTPLPLGVWARIGTAYTTNPSDSTVVYLYQKTLDPDRDFYQYKVVNEHGFEIPLDSNVTELKNGMTFNVPGWESKGPFTANITSGGYSFVYV